jgi:hypothetical protein
MPRLDMDSGRSMPASKPPLLTPEHIWKMTLKEREQMIGWTENSYITANVPWKFRKHLVTIDAEYALMKYRRGQSAKLTDDEIFTLRGDSF